VKPKKLGELGLSLHCRLAAAGPVGVGALDEKARLRALLEGVTYRKVAGEADVREMDLQSEAVDFKRRKKNPRERLEEYGATKEERGFLVEGGPPWHGERVELNAMTSQQFIDYLERKLQEHGVGEVIPDEEALAAAYQLAVRKAAVRKAVDAALRSVPEVSAPVPADLAARVKKALERDPARPWDDAIAAMAKTRIGRGGRPR
jgi:hypothetical protein